MLALPAAAAEAMSTTPSSPAKCTVHVFSGISSLQCWHFSRAEAKRFRSTSLGSRNRSGV